MTEMTSAQLAEAIAARDVTTAAIEGAKPGPDVFRCQVRDCDYEGPSLCCVCPTHQQFVA